MNKIYRIVFNAVSGRWVVASEMAKGRKKQGGGAGAVLPSVLLTGTLGVLAGASGPSYASVVINGNPQEGTVSCEVMTDSGSTTWVVSTSSTNCIVPSSGSASGQGNPGKRAVFYASDDVNGNEDSLNLGGYLDVWKTATFHGGIAMDGQKITGLANGTAATDAATFGQLNDAMRYFKAGGLQDGTDDATQAGKSVAIGANASATDGFTPYNPTSYGNSVAIGDSARALGSGVAIGDHANSTFTNIAIGNGADASTPRHAVVIGIGAKVTGWESTALGSQAIVDGANSVGLGANVVASGNSTVALGANANASAANSVALGYGSTTTANLAAAGYNPGSAALAGTASTANGEVSIGSSTKERRLTNLAAGSAATDAVNVSQLQAEDATVDKLGADTAGRLGGGSTYDAVTGAISAPSYTLANANSIGGTSGAATDVGSGFAKVDSALGKLNTAVSGGGIKYFHANSGAADSAATGAESVAIGPQAASSATNTIAMGGNASSSAMNAVAIGVNSSAASTSSQAIGDSAKVSNAYFGVAIGSNSSVSVATGDANQGVAVGYLSKVSAGGGAMALGAQSTSSASSGVALGSGANVSAVNSVALGAGSTTTATLGNAAYNPGSATLSGTASAANGEVSIGSSTKERRLTNLAAGSAATDAVNVSQLQAEDATVDKLGTDTAGRLGGGAAYNASTGAVSAPSYTLANANTIGGTSGAATDVGSGFAKVDSALGALNTTANKGFNISADAGATSQNIAPGGTVKFAAGTNATVTRTADTITMGVVANPTFSGLITANGGLKVGAAQSIDMGGNKVTNVAAGTAGTDAVNKSQLDAVATTAGGAMGFTGNDATAGVVNRTLGQTLAIKGVASTGGTYSGNNIKTVTDPATGAINVQMADAPTFGAVTVNAGGTGKISGVTAGTAATDAVNKGQLDGLNTIVTKQGTDTASGLGGGAAYNASTGAVSAPSYTLANANTIGGTSGAATDVGSGFAKVDSALGALNTTANKGFNISADAGATSQNIAPGGTVKFAAGSNATVTRTADTITMGVVANPTFSGLITANGGLKVGASQSIDMGGNKVTNVAAGVAGTDAVNKSQLDSVATTANAGWNMQANGGTADKIGAGESVNVADGSNTTVAYDATTNKLQVNVVSAPTFTSVTTGNSKLDTTGLVITGGPSVTTSGINAGSKAITNVAAGVAGTDAVNKSQLDAVAASAGSGPIGFTGNDATAGVVNRSLGQTLAIKGAASTAGTYSGGNIKTVTDPATGAINVQMADAPTFGAVTINAGGTGKITGITDGSIASGSKEAVNGGQLYTTNQQVAKQGTDTAARLGGGAAYDAATGGISAPSYTLANANSIGGTSGAATDVGSGFAKVDSALGKLDNRVTTTEGNITNLQTTINNISTGAAGLVQQSAAGANLTVGKTTDGAAVDFAGTAGARKLINVADGAVVSGSKDAVNGGQLYTTNQAVAQNASDISSLDDRVTTNEGDITTLQGDVNTIDQRVTTNEGDITTLNTNVSNIDGRVTSVEGSVTNITNQINSGTVGLVQQSAAGANLTVGKETDGVAVDFAGTAGARKLINVADGTVASGSKDAVNGSQLYTTNQAMAQNASDISSLDGRVTVNEGQITNLDQRVTTNEGDISTLNTNVSNIDNRMTTAEGSITNLDQRVTKNEGDITTLNTNVSNIDGRVTSVEGSVTNITNQINSGTVGLVQQSVAGANLTVGKDTDGVAVDFAGTAGARKLLNVADGAVASGSKEAVNGGQLSATNDRVTTAEGNITTLQGDVTNLDQRVTTNEGDITNLDYRVTQNSTDIGTLNTNVTNLDNRVTTAEGSITNLDQRVTKNEGDITTLNTNVSNLDGRVTNVEGSVTNITNQLNDGSVGLVRYDDAAGLVTVAKDKAGTAVDFRGTAGARRLKGVAAGGDDEDAVNVSQLKKVADAIGGGASVNSDGSITGPTYYVTNADGSQSTVGSVGDAITNIDGRTYANTTQITNLSQQISSGTVGLVQQAAPGAKLTVGKDTNGTEVSFANAKGEARKLTGVADGVVAADSKDAVNGGQLHAVSQSMASAMGGGSTVNADGTISAPTYRVTNTDGSQSDVHSVGDAITNIDGRTYANTTAIANNTTQITQLSQQITNGEVGLVKQDAATRDITVAKDSDGKTVNFAGTAGDRTLSGVAAGQADNDAVNLGQLKAAGVIDASGQSKAVVSYDNADKTSMTMGGDGASRPVVIHNVADGVDGHDAVNVQQLNDRLQQSSAAAVGEANDYTDARVNDVWNTMDKVAREVVKQDRRISQQGAMSMAESQMASGAAAAAVGNPNGAWSVGVGSEQGHGALSAGYAKPVGKRSQISFGAAFSGDDQSIGMGFAHKL